MAQVNALLNTNATSTVSYVDSTDTPIGHLDADADGARQRQHRHRRRPGLGRDLDHQHHGGERRAGGDDHAGELRGDRADERSTLKNTGLSISDVDAGSGSMTVTLAVTEGTLTVTAGTSGAVVTNSGTSSVTITGTVAQINALLNTNADQHGQLRRQHRYPERRPRR